MRIDNWCVIVLAGCASVAASPVSAQLAGEATVPLAAAPSEKEPMYSMGTGFFVSYDGYVITNEHVVRGCKSAIIRGTVPSMEARIVKVDVANDLALLQAETVPADTAKLSTSNIPPKQNDRVMVIGYPKEHSMTGLYKVSESQIISEKGPQGELNWVQFKRSADHGNSGGPLLDATGNVIGVVQGSVTLTLTNTGTGAVETRQSDVAISLPVLMPFLDQLRVGYRRNPNNTSFTPDMVENMAKQYIVNVVCLPTP